jgi:hypothetical protein
MKKILLLFTSLLLAAGTFCQDQKETVTISPSWGQAFHYANEAGQGKFTFLGILLIAAAVGVVIMGSQDKLTFIGVKQGLAVNLIAFVLMALGLLSLFLKPGEVKWNNDKEVNKIYMDSVGEKHIWDSLENNCLIVEGPFKCK